MQIKNKTHCLSDIPALYKSKINETLYLKIYTQVSYASVEKLITAVNINTEGIFAKKYQIQLDTIQIDYYTKDINIFVIYYND